MSELKLRITVIPDPKPPYLRTVTKIGKKKDEKKIVFLNESKTDVLTMTLYNADPLLYDVKSGTFTFTVAANEEKTFSVRRDAAVGADFKYTAQIGRAAPEDPIIIIEP